MHSENFGAGEKTVLQATPASVAPPNSVPPQYPSDTLFLGHRELLILHHGETYRLRVTRTNKLILTK